MKLSTLAEALGGDLVGGVDVDVTAVADPDHVTPGTIVMVREARHLSQAEASVASALLLPQTLSSSRKPAIRTSNVRVAFARLLTLLHPDVSAVPGTHATALIGQGTRLGADCSIGPYVVIGEDCTLGRGVVLHTGSTIGRGVTIEEGTVIYPHVSIYDRSVIGRRVIVHAGAVIGSDGFGFAPDAGRQIRIPQIGRVVLEDDVEVGANTTIDRATLGETRIGAGTKIDNLVQIGHNVHIGRDVIIVAAVGISGSVTIGDGVTLAGQVGIVDHVDIGAGAIVLARGLVSKDVPPGAVVSGSPIQPHRTELKFQAALRQVPDLLARVAALERSGAAPERPGRGSPSRASGGPRRRGGGRSA